MTKAQIQQILVILLLVLFGLIWTMTRQPHAPTPAGNSPTPAPAAEPLVGPPAPPAKELPPPSRNPFRLPAELANLLEEQHRQMMEPQARPAGPVTRKDPLERLQLQGIFWGTPQPQAIINRQILSVGDEIEGARVVSIGKEGVVLSLEGREVVLEPPVPGKPKIQKRN